MLFRSRLGALLNFLVNGAPSLAPIIPKVGNKYGNIPLLKIDTDIDRTLMYTDTYQVAVDPRICLIKKTINTNTGTLTFEDGNGPDNLGLCSDFNIPIGGITYGRILNIYVNIIFIINTIKSNMDDKGKVDLYTFLKKILEGINLGLGGINDLDLIIDETTNTVHIVDNNPLPGREQFFTNKDTTIFDLYGYKPGSSSFVKDFNFETELTNELATMITVAAQYNGQIPGENSTALSRLNSGLTDRYKTSISSKISTKDYTFDPKEESTNFLKILNDYFEFLQRLSKRETTIEEIDANLVKYKDILQTYDNLKNIDILKEANKLLIVDTKYGPLKYSAQTPVVGLSTLKNSSDLFNTPTSNFTGFIPFNLQLTIDGLSGIKNIQRFLIDGEYLPRNYPNVVEFLIKNIQHDIVGNKWYTKLESYCISKGSSSSNTPKPTLTNISISSERVGGGFAVVNGGSATAGQLAQNSSITSNYIESDPSKFKIKNMLFGSKNMCNEIYLHHTAGPRKADKGLGTINGWNARIPPNIASTHAIIDETGHIEYLIPDEVVAWGQYPMNYTGLSVEILGYGSCQKGHYYKMINQQRVKINGDPNVWYNFYGGKMDEKNDLKPGVDDKLQPIKYRGVELFQKYTPAQISATENLVKYWSAKHSIPLIWDYNRIFPDGNTITITPYMDLVKRKGLYSHCSVTIGKSDIFPQKEMVEMLKRICTGKPAVWGKAKPYN